MLFFDENTFNKDPQFTISKPVDVKEYSYFVEAVDGMLNIRTTNEGYFDDVFEFLSDGLKSSKKHIAGAMKALCKEHYKLSKDTTDKFCTNFSTLIKSNQNWYRSNSATLQNYSGGTVAPAGICYKFTNLDNREIPNPSNVKNMIRSMQNVAENISKYGSTLEEKRLNMDIEYEKLYNLIHFENYYDNVRASTLSSKGRIKIDDFPKAVFEKFRDNGNERLEPFSATEIKSIYKNFANYDKYIKEIKSLSREMDSMYKSIESALDIMEKRGSEFSYDEKLFASYNKYMTIAQDNAYRVLEIYLMVLAGKLDAISKSYLQDLEVLKNASNNEATIGKEVAE